MEDLRIITTGGTDTILDEATVQGFKTSVRGPLLRPGIPVKPQLWHKS